MPAEDQTKHFVEGLRLERQRKWEAAQERYRQALQQYETENTPIIGRTHHQLGRVFQKQHQWDPARQSFELALEWLEKANEKTRIGITHHHLGRVSIMEYDWESAAEHFQKALQQLQINAIPFQLGVAHYWLALLFEKQQAEDPILHCSSGIVFKKRNHWERSLDYFLQTVQGNVTPFDQHTAHYLIGQIYGSHGEPVKSNDHRTLALEWFRQNRPTETKIIQHTLSLDAPP